MLKKKVVSGLLNVFVFCFSFLLAVLFIGACFFSGMYNEMQSPFQLVFLCFVLLFVLVTCFLYSRAAASATLRKRKPSTTKYIMAALFAAIFVYQLAVIFSISSPLGWDVGILVGVSRASDMSIASVYFSNYPNNLFLLFVFRIVMAFCSVFKIYNIWLVLCIINVVCIDAALIMTVVLAKKLLGLRASFVAQEIILLLTLVFPWVVVPYSDTFSMPFTIGIFFFLVLLLGQQKDGASKIKTKNNNLKKGFFAFLLGLCVVVGTLIKPTTVIVFIALLLVGALLLIENPKKALPWLKYAAVALLAVALLFTGYGIFLNLQRMIFVDPELQMPPSHFMLMGMNQTFDNEYIAYGGHISKFVDFSLSFPTYAERDAACRAMISAQLNEYGALGYLGFLWNKLCWIMFDGKFYWGREGDFMFYDKIHTSPNIFTSLFYHNANPPMYSLYKNSAQAVWQALLLGSSLGGFIKKEGNRQWVLLAMRVAFVGLLLYLLLFEARSRYLINNLPILIVLAADGYEKLWGEINGLAKRLKRKEKQEIAA